MPHDHDEYIKRLSIRARLRLPSAETAGQIEPQLKLTDDEALEAAVQLYDLDWNQGHTRDRLRQVYPDLPLAIYLRLPDSKRFTSAGEVLHEAGLSASRAEGDFMGARPDYPDEQSIADGGPPGWGTDDAVLDGQLSIDGGSTKGRVDSSLANGD
jgi:hypothetical protein